MVKVKDLKDHFGQQHPRPILKCFICGHFSHEMFCPGNTLSSADVPVEAGREERRLRALEGRQGGKGIENG